MRLATFNVMSGRTLADGLVDEGRFAESIAALDADVLALQEVDRNQPRSQGLDLTAIAAAAAGAVASRFEATMVGVPRRDWRPAPYGGAGDPRYGLALLSRYPVRDWYVRRMRAAPVRGPVLMPGRRGGVALLDDEPRLALAAVVAAPSGPITVACAHLSFVPAWNAGQLGGMLRWLRRLPAPRFLLGDLNLPAAATLALAGAAGWHLLARRPTYPSGAPRIQFDHILAHPRRPRVGVAWAATPAVPVSDHRPLVVEVT